jgi:hypothetical protein
MSVSSCLSWLKNRSLFQKDARRRRRNPVLLGNIGDWLLEDRCLLSDTPFPTKMPGLDPTPDNIKTVASLSNVFYTGVPSKYTETVTITNSAPIGGPTVYAFLQGEISKQAVANYNGTNYTGTAQYDPYDASNQEYRGYIGYKKDGTSNYYAGLAPQTSITVTVPIAFWDSGRILFTTDSADLFNTYSGNGPYKNGVNANPTGAPFNYLDQNTQAIYFGNIAANSKQLNFTPIYNDFAGTNHNGIPIATNWKSPVKSGLFENKEQFIVTGPGLPANDIGTVNTSTNNGQGSITLQQANGALPITGGQYTFSTIKPASSPQPSISQTARFLQTGFTLTTKGSPSTTNGAVMWYHALTASAPNNDAPFQLTELTFRNAYYGSITGFVNLMGGSTSSVYTDAIKPAADYDVSYVDSINMPIAMEATNVTINNTGGTSAAFGWVGSSDSLAAFQGAIATFASNNAGANFLGQYFGGKGFPSYITVQQGNLKLPSGQNLFFASPTGGGGVADIKYYMFFSGNNSSEINEQRYTLSSAGGYPVKLSDGGDINVQKNAPGSKYLALNKLNGANNFIVQTLIPQELAKKLTLNAIIHPPNGGKVQTWGTVTGLWHQNNDPKNPTILGVILSQDVPSNAGVSSWDFAPSPIDYAGAGIASLWYAWAKYYVAKNTGTAPTNPVGGTIKSGTNILTLNNAKDASGLVPGMTVTAASGSGGTLPQYCVILAISGNQITLSTKVLTGNPTSFNFAKPDLKYIVGSNEGLTIPTLSFTAAQQAYALKFAQTVYTVMSAWSPSYNRPLAPVNGINKPVPAWNQLLSNIIGGNLSTDYLPYEYKNDDDPVHSVPVILTNMSKSLLRGVPDYIKSDPAQWYPDPALKTGGLDYNAYNLDPVVWFVHAKLGLSAYAFALDDDYGNVNAPGANNVAISVDGLNGLKNQIPYSEASPWGVVTTTGTLSSSKIGTLTNPTTPSGLNLKTGQVVNMFIIPKNKPGPLVNGPGVKMATTVTPNGDGTVTLVPSQTGTTPSGSAYSFWGQLQFTGKLVYVNKLPTDQIIFNSPVAYSTLNKLGPLNNVRVTGEGIDPNSTPVTIKSVTQNTQAGTTTVTLSSALNANLIGQNLVGETGTFYSYTFGDPRSTPPTLGSPPPAASPPPVTSPSPGKQPVASNNSNGGGGGFSNTPVTFPEVVSLVVDDALLVLDQIVEAFELAQGGAPNPGLMSAIATDQNAINTNPLDNSFFGQALFSLIQMDIFNALSGMASQ